MPQRDITTKEITFSNSILLPEIITLLNEGHTVTLGLKGNSMRPFLEDGRDKALLVKPEEIHVGDPVLAEISGGRYVLHRIIGIKGSCITLLGDGNLTPERCNISDIKGAVAGFYRKGRKKLERTDSKKWRIYSFFWTRLRPVRRYLLSIYRHICL